MSALWSFTALLLSQAPPPDQMAEHVEQMTGVGAGKIVGGWEYVWACYIITWVGIALYGISLQLRLRARKEGAKP